MTEAPSTYAPISYAKRATWLIAGLLIFRSLALLVSPYQLHGDEAQYWAWAQDLDFGYYSKPPMVAWVIAMTTGVFGDAEWAIRLGSPIIHSITATLLFLTGRKIGGPQAGFWACAIYLLMPAVWLSSMIISTDVALLMFWALAMHAWVCLREQISWVRVVQLGLALGLGLMSKYAMSFFAPALLLAVLFDPPTRRALLHWRGLVVIGLAALMITPNIIWNINHDFATVAHTAENANLKQDFFHPQELLGFWGDQFVVFGPVTLALLIRALIAAFRRRLPRPGIWLAALCATPLIAISIEALISRANANWAVTAYAAAPLVLALWTVSQPKIMAWLRWGVIGQSILAVVLIAIVLVPGVVDSLGLSNSVKRLRGWDETVTQISAQYTEGHDGQAFQSIAVDNRLVFYDTEFYGLRDTAPLYVWMLKSRPNNHAEMTFPLPKTAGAPILLINYYENYRPFFSEDFKRLEPLPNIEIDLGGGKRRVLRAWAGYEYTPTTDPNRAPDKIK